MNEVVPEELVRLKADSSGSGYVFVSDKTGMALGWIKRGFAAAVKPIYSANLDTILRGLTPLHKACIRDSFSNATIIDCRSRPY
jgi:hypothetical protein